MRLLAYKSLNLIIAPLPLQDILDPPNRKILKSPLPFLQGLHPPLKSINNVEDLSSEVSIIAENNEIPSY